MSLPSVAPTWPQPPAYNAVTPRRSLIPHMAGSEPSGAAPSRSSPMQWPDPVREYVRRAFDPQNAAPGINTTQMQAKLKDTINFYAARKALDDIDWPSYPLPQQLLLAERETASAASASGGLPAPANVVNSASANVTAPVHADRAVPVQANGSNSQTNLASPASNKRKSQDQDELQAQQSVASVPPWRRTNLESRMTFDDGRHEKRQKKSTASGDNFSKFDQADLDKRRQRFQLGQNNNTTPPWGPPRRDQDDMSTAIVVGTNQSLEKSYFRLTAPPKPETVRPLHILVKALAFLMTKWKAEKNYNYICNQFKSLRQDLTVQHIKSNFTVKVYETHARLALEKADLGEYNQCQTQLKALYAMGLEGNPSEFKAYRILYFVHTCNKTDMNDMLAELTPADKSQRYIKHALDVRSALALGNYHKFFRLYLAAENMGSYLMDMFIERERFSALANISKAYVYVSLRFLTDELGFETDDSCREFLETHADKSIIEKRTDDKNVVHLRVSIRTAAQRFDSLRATAFSKVDIKGQI